MNAICNLNFREFSSEVVAPKRRYTIQYANQHYAPLTIVHIVTSNEEVGEIRSAVSVVSKATLTAPTQR